MFSAIFSSVSSLSLSQSFFRFFSILLGLTEGWGWVRWASVPLPSLPFILFVWLFPSPDIIIRPSYLCSPLPSVCLPPPPPRLISVTKNLNLFSSSVFFHFHSMWWRLGAVPPISSNRFNNDKHTNPLNFVSRLSIIPIVYLYLCSSFSPLIFPSTFVHSQFSFFAAALHLH